MTTAQKTVNIREQISKEEWEARVDLAAAYRLVAHYGWDDLIFTHLSARVPGPEHHFLINPYGMMFEEITASSLIKINLAARSSCLLHISLIRPVSPFIARCTRRGKTRCASFTCILKTASRFPPSGRITANLAASIVCIIDACLPRLRRPGAK